jgi:hypothetical protein
MGIVLRFALRLLYSWGRAPVLSVYKPEWVTDKVENKSNAYTCRNTNTIFRSVTCQFTNCAIPTKFSQILAYLTSETGQFQNLLLDTTLKLAPNSKVSNFRQFIRAEQGTGQNLLCWPSNKSAKSQCKIQTDRHKSHNPLSVEGRVLVRPKSWCEEKVAYGFHGQWVVIICNG